MTTLNWGIIGLGGIARQFVTTAKANVWGVATGHDPARARAFAAEYGIPHAYASLAAMCDDPAIDVIYVANTHNFHYPDIKTALTAGKHVLAEKAITLNATQLAELIALAASRHLILMEAQTTYHLPLYPALAAFREAHHVGRLKAIQASIGERVPVDMYGRFYDPKLAGGALLDMGIYPLSLIRALMTATPELTASQVEMSATGVDLDESFLLNNANREQASFHATLLARLPNRAIATYENGYFLFNDANRTDSATYYPLAGEPEVIQAGDAKLAMAYEVQDMQHAVATGENPTLAWTVDTMAIMTAARKAWGLRYPAEA
ncbi:Gfo/Idh/MocA family protein [Lacticaseibacillus suihuaensis]